MILAWHYYQASKCLFKIIYGANKIGFLHTGSICFLHGYTLLTGINKLLFFYWQSCGLFLQFLVYFLFFCANQGQARSLVFQYFMIWNIIIRFFTRIMPSIYYCPWFNFTWIGVIHMHGSIGKPQMAQILKNVKLKFGNSTYVLCELFSLQCSFSCWFITFSRHFKLIV